MKRLDDSFLETLERYIPFKDSRVLEVGCGDGERAVVLASRCKSFVGIDPSLKCFQAASGRWISKAVFYRQRAESMPFRRGQFDVVLFSLSLCNLRRDKMSRAVDRALFVAGRGTSKPGYIVFLESNSEDSSCVQGSPEGHEQKKAAQEVISSQERLVFEHEITDQLTAKRVASIFSVR